MYLLVRQDIPQPHRQVQLAHAAVAATLSYGSSKVSHPNLVCCGVADERELLDTFEQLKEQGIPVVLWREEDMGGEATAIGTGLLRDQQRKALRRFRLLKE